MTPLMKLELRRTSLRPYCLAALWVLLGVGLLTGLMAALPAMSAAAGEELEADELLLFSRWESLLPVVGVLNMAAFSIFSGVVGARFVVSEYSGGRAILLLSYPVSRRAVMGAKCTIVWGFSALASLLSMLVITAALALFSRLAGLVGEPFGPAQLGWALGLALSQALMSGAAGVLSLPFGLRRGSAVSTVVAAVVLACLCAQVLSALPSLPLLGASAALLTLLALVVTISLGCRAEWMEAL